MKEHLEDILDGYGVNATISFSSELRDQVPWFTDRERFVAHASSGYCPVHALSFDTVPIVWFTEGLLRAIPEKNLAMYAPDYHKEMLLEGKWGDLYESTEGARYALSGYHLPAARNVFHLMARKTTREQFRSSSDPQPLFDDDDSHAIPTYLYEPVDFSELDNNLRNIASDSGRPALFAWSNFEHSFAPLYSAFSIHTMGSNLMSIDNNMRAGISYFEDPTNGPVPNVISDPFREFVRTLSEWYSAGVINPDFEDLTYDDVKSIDLREYSYVSIPFGSATLRNPIFRAFALPKNDEPEEAIGLFQVMLSGHSIVASLARSPFLFVEAYCGDVNEQQLNAMLVVFDYTRVPTVPESDGWMMRVFGQETDHYHRVGTMIEPLPREPKDKHNPFLMWHFKRFPELILSQKQLSLMPSYVGSRWTQDIDFSIASEYPPLGWYAVGSMSHDTRTHLMELTANHVYSWIKGISAIDDEWDNYVDEWLSAGGSEIVDYLN